MVGFPGEGDPPDPADPGEDPNPPAPDPIEAIRAEVAELRRENTELRRLIPPAAPKATPNPEPPASEEPDWEKELFANPKTTMRKAIDIAKKEIGQELRSEYQRDRGTADFWDKFYSLHPDLRDDSDLVTLVLNSNLSSLANMRVEDAYKKLAELTRDRILRYAGGAARSKGRKARAESGITPVTPSPSTEKEENADVTSISDVLRARRNKRRGQLGAA
jgi:hypothetical protein